MTGTTDSGESRTARWMPYTASEAQALIDRWESTGGATTTEVRLARSLVELDQRCEEAVKAAGKLADGVGCDWVDHPVLSQDWALQMLARPASASGRPT